ncbi:hypothetical protein B0H19DRAFT_1071363 [Mycena capillaripes]|nr:hypothetical protein B0H19DRAFT_1071363 [Mycena capillaripes]
MPKSKETPVTVGKLRNKNRSDDCCHEYSAKGFSVVELGWDHDRIQNGIEFALNELPLARNHLNSGRKEPGILFDRYNLGGYHSLSVCVMFTASWLLAEARRSILICVLAYGDCGAHANCITPKVQLSTQRVKKRNELRVPFRQFKVRGSKMKTHNASGMTAQRSTPPTVKMHVKQSDNEEDHPPPNIESCVLRCSRATKFQYSSGVNPYGDDVGPSSGSTWAASMFNILLRGKAISSTVDLPTLTAGFDVSALFRPKDS